MVKWLERSLVRVGRVSSRSMRVCGSGIAVAALLTGCAAAPTPEVTNGDEALVEGRDIYINQCASCHGSDGSGGRGTRFTDGAVVASYPEIADQIAVVTDGLNSMPAFGGRLEAGEIEAVVRFTREVLAETVAG